MHGATLKIITMFKSWTRFAENVEHRICIQNISPNTSRKDRCIKESRTNTESLEWIQLAGYSPMSVFRKCGTAPPDSINLLAPEFYISFK